jgi:para-nitrobenzyl esterase
MKLRMLFAAGLLLVPALTAAAEVTLSSGRIEGERLDDIDRYLGVPYARPPVGALRWRAPQPPEAWTGTRPALTPGHACMQRGNFFASDDERTFDLPYGDEDCLFLNVWAPVADGERPLLIFFHGGSGIAGDSAHPLYDGTRLARALDAVVITANYRLGVWGSLQSPALETGDAAEDSGSFFLLDMVRVLDWARANCPALGCDAGRITISGQSAGAVAVLGLLRSPLAKGKFQQAISFSGLPFSASDETASERTRTLLTGLLSRDGHATDDRSLDAVLAGTSELNLRDYLQGQSAEALLAASGRGLSPAYVADGTVLMALPDANPDKLAAQVVSKVPLLIGSTRDEMTTLVPIDSKAHSARRLWPLFNGEPRDQTIGEQLGWWGAIKRHVSVGLAGWFINRKLRSTEHDYAEQLPSVHVYRFEWDHFPEPWRSDLGSFHALDIPFIFGNFIDDRAMYMRFAWTAENRTEREALHRRITKRLRAFVHTGDPNDSGDELPQWQPWGRQEPIEVWGS